MLSFYPSKFERKFSILVCDLKQIKKSVCPKRKRSLVRSIIKKKKMTASRAYIHKNQVFFSNENQLIFNMGFVCWFVIYMFVIYMYI